MFVPELGDSITQSRDQSNPNEEYIPPRQLWKKKELTGHSRLVARPQDFGVASDSWETIHYASTSSLSHTAQRAHGHTQSQPQSSRLDMGSHRPNVTLERHSAESYINILDPMPCESGASRQQLVTPVTSRDELLRLFDEVANGYSPSHPSPTSFKASPSSTRELLADGPEFTERPRVKGKEGSKLKEVVNSQVQQMNSQIPTSSRLPYDEAKCQSQSARRHRHCHQAGENGRRRSKVTDATESSVASWGGLYESGVVQRSDLSWFYKDKKGK